MNKRKGRRFRARAILGVMAVFVLVTLLDGCAPRRSVANWQNPDKPKELWSEDIGDCRRHARREVERRAGIPALGAPTDPLAGNTTYNQSMSKYELQRFQQSTFDRCMKRRGYVPIAK